MSNKDNHLPKASVTQTILEKIQRGEIKMRPRSEILAHMVGWVALLVGAIGLVMVAGYTLVAWFRISEAPRFLAHGSLGLAAFFDEFPYLWLLIGIVGLVTSFVYLKHFDFSYKLSHPFLMLGVALIGLVIGASLVAPPHRHRPAVERFIEYGAPGGLMNPAKRMLMQHHGVIGFITDQNGNQYRVQAIDDRLVTVETSDKTKFIPPDYQPKVGDEIEAVGKPKPPQKALEALILKQVRD